MQPCADGGPRRDALQLATEEFLHGLALQRGPHGKLVADFFGNASYCNLYRHERIMPSVTAYCNHITLRIILRVRHVRLVLPLSAVSVQSSGGDSGPPSPSLRRRPESRKSSLETSHGFKAFRGLVFLGPACAGSTGVSLSVKSGQLPSPTAAIIRLVMYTVELVGSAGRTPVLRFA